tara:strand:+ start:15817 stop:16812 length:996 start_codon:yes stop_codon:yes gene_type:complete
MSSCTEEYQSRIIDDISIKTFRIDSVSIRTIVAVDADKVYFAASNGRVGYQWDEQKFEQIKFIKYADSISPNFRSLATNGTDYFALSIGNPALLYNLSKDTLVYKETHEKVFYDSMKFFDTLNGIAIGDPTDDCLSIILTNDGGNTWTKISCDKLPKISDGEAAFAASNTNIKLLGKTAWIVTGGKKARVFKSTDLAITWEVFETPIIQGENSQGIYSVDFADENNGIIIGGDYLKSEENLSNKAITFDGGKTWELVADGENPNYKSCVQYVPGTNGKEVFAVGKTGISYSKNGGISWNEVSKDEFYTIQFVDRNTAWLAGNKKIGKLILP